MKAPLLRFIIILKEDGELQTRVQIHQGKSWRGTWWEVSSVSSVCVSAKENLGPIVRQSGADAQGWW